MIILGIDPGSRVTGFGLIDQQGNRLTHIDSGCIRTGDGDWASRLQVVYNEIFAVVDTFRPDEAAIEQVFMARNADSALKLGQARGAAIVAMANQGLSVAEYSARQVKQAVVGKGAAVKSQMQMMVQHLLKLDETPATDAADALGIAICHAHMRQSLIRMAGASKVRRRRIR